MGKMPDSSTIYLKNNNKKRNLVPPLPPLIMFVVLAIILKKIRSEGWGCVIWSIGTLFMIHLLNPGLCLPCTNDYRFTFFAGGVTPGWNRRYPLMKSKKKKDMAGKKKVLSNKSIREVLQLWTTSFTESIS